MWTKEHREAHKQSGNGFPSDLTDAQWARLESLIPPPELLFATGSSRVHVGRRFQGCCLPRVRPRPISNGPWGLEPRDLIRFGIDGSVLRGKTNEQGRIVPYAGA